MKTTEANIIINSIGDLTKALGNKPQVAIFTNLEISQNDNSDKAYAINSYQSDILGLAIQSLILQKEFLFSNNKDIQKFLDDDKYTVIFTNKKSLKLTLALENSDVVTVSRESLVSTLNTASILLTSQKEHFAKQLLSNSPANTTK